MIVAAQKTHPWPKEKAFSQPPEVDDMRVMVNNIHAARKVTTAAMPGMDKAVDMLINGS